MLQRGGACSPLLHNVIVFAGYEDGDGRRHGNRGVEWNGMELWNLVRAEETSHYLAFTHLCKVQVEVRHRNTRNSRNSRLRGNPLNTEGP